MVMDIHFKSDYLSTQTIIKLYVYKFYLLFLNDECFKQFRFNSCMTECSKYTLKLIIMKGLKMISILRRLCKF